jgi:phosphoribosylamine--glycine ligase
MSISGITEAEALEEVVVFQAGTASGPGEEPLVAGGRVLAVTALGTDLSSAVARAYQGVERIRFDGMHYRTDVARDAIAARCP